jgi:predicted ATPase
LDRLTRETKEVVQTAAVLGREFDLRLLTHMLQQDIGAMVNAAVQKQIWSLLNDLQYIFNHVLMRDAAYEMQLRARLRDVHYSAAVIGEQLYAAVLAPHYRTLAYHYEMAYLLGQTEARARAQQYLGLAGQQASANFEKGVPIDYFTRALSLTEAADVTGQYQLTLARAKEYGTQGNRPAQNSDLQALVILARELTVAEQAAVALEQANYAEVLSDYEQTIAHAQEAIRLGQQVGALELVAGGYREWGLALWRQGQYPAAANRSAFTHSRLIHPVDNPVH